MNWLIGVWIKIQLWWFKLLGKTTLDNKIIEAVKEVENSVKKVKKKKRGRKPKKKN